MIATHHSAMMAGVLRQAPAANLPSTPNRATQQADVMDTLRLRIEMRYRDLASAFRAIDKDSSGFLTRDEITSALADNNIPTRHIESLLRGLDTNHDGLVSFAEFSAALRPSAAAFASSSHDRFVTNRHVIAPNVAGGQVLINDNLAQALARPGEIRPDAALLPLPSGGTSAAPAQLNEYTSAMSSLIYAKHGLLRDAFRALDTNKDCRLSLEELKRAVRVYNLPIPERHVEGMFATMRGRDGQVDYEAFAAALKRRDALGN